MGDRDRDAGVGAGAGAGAGSFAAARRFFEQFAMASESGGVVSRADAGTAGTAGTAEKKVVDLMVGKEKVGQMDNGKGGVEQKEPGEPKEKGGSDSGQEKQEKPRGNREPKEKGGSDSGQEKQEKPCGQANDSVYFSADDTL